MAAEFLSGGPLYRDVVTYARLGEHRTATEVDAQTSEWIAGELQAAGLKTRFQTFDVRQFFIREVKLTVAGQSVECFPLWPPCSTGAKPTVAPLVTLSPETEPSLLRGRIALVRFPHSASIYPGSGHQEIISQAGEAGAVAIVGVPASPSGEIVAANSANPEPWPIPVVVIAARDEPTLAAAAEQGVEASLLLDGKDEPWAEARNVIGRLDAGEELIVVSTPQSGWFRCAAERGPGIALFLGLARWVGQRRPSPSYVFVSTSGHELGGLGMRSFIGGHDVATNTVRCWLHLGASIAAWGWEESRRGLRRRRQRGGEVFLCGSPEFQPLLGRVFADMPDLQPITGPARGELALVMQSGYRAFGFFGGHRFFHTPADGPEVTAPELLEPVGSALASALESIEQMGKA